MSGTALQLPLGDLAVAGGALPGATLHVRTWGDPVRGERAGWTLVFHALTGSAAVDEWWGPLLQPGGPLDPAVRPVACANLLGSCYGSTGPATWGGDGVFPRLAVRDLARAHDAVLAALGIRRLALAVGSSLGGMVALEFARRSPVPIGHLAVIAAPARATARAIGWSAAQRMALDAAPPGSPAGLAAARAIAMLTYRGARGLEARFANGTSSAGRWAVEEWLAHHGRALVARFDATSYRVLLDALDGHDLGPLEAAAAEIAARVARVTGVGISTDILYPPATVRRWVRAFRRHGTRARYREIASPHGHDAFLMEWEQVREILAEGERET